MSREDEVKAKWPDAEIVTAFALQPNGTKRWMFCIMSELKLRAGVAVRDNYKILYINLLRLVNKLMLNNSNYAAYLIETDVEIPK